MSITFNELLPEEQEILFLTPVKAAILIGGADEDFDKIERRVAKELTHVKSYTSKGELKKFYSVVANRFLKDLNELMDTYPQTAEKRSQLIMEELANTRAILDKLEGKFQIRFVKTILEISRYVAEASGGILGLLSINQQEYKAILELEKTLKAPASVPVVSNN